MINWLYYLTKCILLFGKYSSAHVSEMFDVLRAVPSKKQQMHIIVYIITSLKRLLRSQSN